MGVTQLRKFIIPSSSSSRPDTWTTISPSSLGWWPWLGQKIGLLVVRGTDINKWREKMVKEICWWDYLPFLSIDLDLFLISLLAQNKRDKKGIPCV